MSSFHNVNLMYISIFIFICSFYYYYLLLFNYSCPTFFPVALPCSTHSPLLYPLPQQSIPSPLSMSMGPLDILLDLSLPLLSAVTPVPFPSGHWQLVFYFHVSDSILLFCLFCWLGFSYRWDYMVFVSPPGLFHLAYCSPVPSMLLRRVGALSSFLLHSFPLCKCITVFSSTHL